MKKLNNTLVVVPYDPHWKTEFERIRDYLMKQIGDLVIDIRHVGSTSVPGLCAKPIIDIVAIMESYEVFPQIVSRLEKVGFQHEGDLGVKEREAFKRLIPDDFMNYHFYICPKDSEEYRRQIRFRNALIKNPQFPEEYGKLKTRLIGEVNGDRVLYTNSKSDFVLDVMNRVNDEGELKSSSQNILIQNKNSWDAIADSFFGVTALPIYGCLCPTEDELCLFPDLSGKKVLDIGCGSGHSLKWCGDKGAIELWGLDISDRQLENAQKYLAENGYVPRLFCSPMEDNPGLPTGYFDVVYSIYAIGWTVDLQKTFDLISIYLKPGGIFVFSWDHPFMHCVDVQDEKLMFSGSYFEREPFTFLRTGSGKGAGRSPSAYEEGGNPLTLYNRRMSDYINALTDAGMVAVRVVEETDNETMARDCEFSSQYYSPCKAKRFPLSIIVKARKI